MDQIKRPARKTKKTPKKTLSFFTQPFYHLYCAKWLYLLILPVILVLVRSINLLGLPMYLDEGLYIFWAGLFSKDSSFAYLPLTDGKAPLFMWLVGDFNRFFHDFLLTGRMLSVLAGGVTVVCWMIILRMELGKKFVWMFWLMALVVPYAFVIERMAFVDTLMTALLSFGTMSLVWALKNSSRRYFVLFSVFGGFLAGLGLGFAYMTKTSARAFLVVFLIVGAVWIIRVLLQRKFISVLGIIITSAVMYLTYHELLSDFRIGAHLLWGMIDVKEQELTYTLPQIFNNLIVKHNPGIYRDSLPFIFSYFTVYLGGLSLLAVFGIFRILKKRRDLIWLVLYFMISTVGIFLSARMMSSRYFYPVVPSFLALSAIGGVALWEYRLKLGKVLVAIILTALAVQSSLYLFSPLHGLYAYDDQRYFTTGDISALGMYDVKNYLTAAPDQSIVGVSGIWGIPQGVVTELSSDKITAVDLGNWFQAGDPDKNKGCEKDTKFYQGKCWRLNLGIVMGSSRDKYLYLTQDQGYLPIIGLFYTYNIEKEYLRPGSSHKVYLIKID